MTKKYKVSINRDSCIGCSVCASSSPDTFEINEDDGLAKMKLSQKPEDAQILELNENQLKNLEEVIDSCPSQVIKIEK